MPRADSPPPAPAPLAARAFCGPAALDAFRRGLARSKVVRPVPSEPDGRAERRLSARCAAWPELARRRRQFVVELECATGPLCYAAALVLLLARPRAPRSAANLQAAGPERACVTLGAAPLVCPCRASQSLVQTHPPPPCTARKKQMLATELPAGVPRLCRWRADREAELPRSSASWRARWRRLAGLLVRGSLLIVPTLTFTRIVLRPLARALTALPPSSDCVSRPRRFSRAEPCLKNAERPAPPVNSTAAGSSRLSRCGGGRRRRQAAALHRCRASPACRARQE